MEILTWLGWGVRKWLRIVHSLTMEVHLGQVWWVFWMARLSFIKMMSAGLLSLVEHFQLSFQPRQSVCCLVPFRWTQDLCIKWNISYFCLPALFPWIHSHQACFLSSARDLLLCCSSTWTFHGSCFLISGRSLELRLPNCTILHNCWTSCPRVPRVCRETCLV